MMSKATHIVPLDLSGPKGETLFWDVYLDMETIKPSIEKIQKEFLSLQEHLTTLQDERSLSLVGAMIIESYLDQLLKSYIPNYKKLEDVRDFTFSFKIELTHSFKLIPAKILYAFQPIRKIRNNFAHKLQIKNYKDYIQALGKTDFDEVYNKMRTFGEFPKSTPRKMFESLITSISYGLLFYTELLKAYSNKTRDRKFVDALFNNATTLSDNYKDKDSKKMFSVEKLK